MKHFDEQLDAYVDGELPDAKRTLIAEAIAQDPNLAQRVARQRTLRDRLRENFDGVLHEPVPDRLMGLVTRATLEAIPPALDLSAARDKQRRRGGSPLSSKSAGSPSLPASWWARSPVF